MLTIFPHTHTWNTQSSSPVNLTAMKTSFQWHHFPDALAMHLSVASLFQSDCSEREQESVTFNTLKRGILVLVGDFALKWIKVHLKGF